MPRRRAQSTVASERSGPQQDNSFSARAGLYWARMFAGFRCPVHIATRAENGASCADVRASDPRAPRLRDNAASRIVAAGPRGQSRAPCARRHGPRNGRQRRGAIHHGTGLSMRGTGRQGALRRLSVQRRRACRYPTRRSRTRCNREARARPRRTRPGGRPPPGNRRRSGTAAAGVEPAPAGARRRALRRRRLRAGHFVPAGVRVLSALCGRPSAQGPSSGQASSAQTGRPRPRRHSPTVAGGSSTLPRIGAKSVRVRFPVRRPSRCRARCGANAPRRDRDRARRGGGFRR